MSPSDEPISSDSVSVRGRSKSHGVSGDVVVEIVGGYSDLAQTAPAILRGVSESAFKLRAPGAPKLTYIYTSGMWIHGGNRKGIVSDTTPITKPIDLVTWRIPLEQAVIKDLNLNGIIIRPVPLPQWQRRAQYWDQVTARLLSNRWHRS